MKNFSLPEKYKLVLNTSSDTVRAIAGMTDETVRNMLCQQLYDLARLSSRPLEGDQLRAFMKRSGDIAALLAEKAQ